MTTCSSECEHSDFSGYYVETSETKLCTLQIRLGNFEGYTEYISFINTWIKKMYNILT